MKLTELYPEVTSMMVLDNTALQVSLTPKAKELKVAALESSALVGKVDNAKQQEVAVAAQSELDSVIRLTEKARRQIKQPVIELGRRIDTKAEVFVKELTEERGRVTMLIGNFQQAELARVRAAEAATKLEADSLERERQEQLASAPSIEDMDAIHERFNAQSEALAAKPVAVAVKAQGQ